MIGRIINFAKFIGGKIPIVKNFITQSETPKINPAIFHGRNDGLMRNEILTLESKNKNQTIQDVKEWLLKTSGNRVIDKKFPEFGESIKKLISKIEHTGTVDFKEKNLKAFIIQYQEKLTKKFEEEIAKLNNKNFDANNHVKYIELWNDYIVENKRLMLEATDQILLSTCQLELVNDLDLTSALKVSKDITKEIASICLNTITEQLNNIPIGFKLENEKTKKNYRDLLKEEYLEDITNLHLMTKFGLFSEEIILRSFSKINKNFSKLGKSLFEDLTIIKNLQDAIHCGLIIKREDLDKNNFRIGMVDREIVKNAFESLTSLYFDYVELRSKYIPQEEYQIKKNQILSGIRDLKNFIYNLGLIENLGLIKLQEDTNENLWNRLGIDKKEVTSTINNTYKKINWLSERTGVIKGEKILGYEFQDTPVMNLINEANEDRVDQIKRILLEVSIVAGTKVILEARNKDHKKLDFTQKRYNSNNKVLPATINFESLPWLKDYYNQSVEYYQSLLNKEVSNFKIAPIIKELSMIGKELRTSKLFTASDFFNRYGLLEEEDELINLIGEMTDIGRMRLNIDFVSNFLSYLNDENNILNKQEITNIKLLINYLSKECKVRDKNGKEIYSPTKYEPEIEKVYDKMKNIVGKTSFLSLNTPLIINFLKKTFGKFGEQDKKIIPDSFEANNQVLASWLFYVLVKFLPEKSSDNDALKSRIEIYRTLMDENFQNQAKFNTSLFKKMVKQARGLEENENMASKDNRKGVIKALCLDLENHINSLIKGQPSNSNIKNLLNYYQEIENINKRNPKSLNKILEVQKNIFRTNEPLIKPLEESLIKVYEKSPATVLEFVKSQKEKNPHYLEKFSKDLLNTIEQTLKNIKINNRKISLLDSDQKTISTLVSCYENIINLGYVFNKNSSDQIELVTSLFKTNETEKQKIQNAIRSIKQFMESKIELKSDSRFSPEEESFENQFELKNRLKQLARNKILEGNSANLTLAA
jgi:hypothetical protein